jgi:hypothetical protein
MEEKWHRALRRQLFLNGASVKSTRMCTPQRENLSVHYLHKMFSCESVSVHIDRHVLTRKLLTTFQLNLVMVVHIESG